MFQKKMNAFCKSEDCPTSHELLSYQSRDVGPERALEITEHLAVCEFCDAELDMYSHFPLADLPAETAKIPAPLYELAEALLRLRHTNPNTLDQLLTDKEPLIEAQPL